MTTLYHCHVSCVRSDIFEEIFWQEGYWSLISTNDITEVINVTHEMKDKLRNDMKNSLHAQNYQAIIAIIKNYVNNDDNNIYDDDITIQQLYIGCPIISKEDLCFDKPYDKISRYDIFHDTCYRDDTKNTNNIK
ncbi:hypothetical protein QKU48_gp1123 [Fadolivirus algeromassiliense]|jgi:hypothetical protein|uniref:Uncharacterized protein n=1 Tax=Fadolivirus FV1/VV64 TaxID=3070911 RepID=A0A7D3R1U3_9VIRU|nr:hypothetical protein QKU48_gp1123 [Fadolivirus algeromassiliense]QKF94581.1 hypothetical protein Fadolivirus_1_1123 [Fadolivirus FV1/VV64]